jgi:hypothetical protein
MRKANCFCGLEIRAAGPVNSTCHQGYGLTERIKYMLPIPLIEGSRFFNTSRRINRALSDPLFRSSRQKINKTVSVGSSCLPLHFRQKTDHRNHLSRKQNSIISFMSCLRSFADIQVFSGPRSSCGITINISTLF